MFYIKRKVKKEAENPVNTVIKNDLSDRFLLTPRQVREVISRYENDLLHLEKILKEIEKKYKAGEIEKLGAYTFKTLMEGQHEKSLFDEEIEATKVQKQQQEEEKAVEKKLLEQQKQEEQAEKEKLLSQIEKALSEDEKEELEKEFEDYISKSHLHQLSKRPRGKKVLRQNFLAKKFLSEEE